MRDILLIHDYPPTAGGGIEVNTFNLAKELTKRGFKVTILTSRSSSETFTYTKTKKIKNLEIIVNADKNAIKTAIANHQNVVVMCTFSLRPAMMTALEILNELNKKHFAYIRTNTSHLTFSRLSKISQQIAHTDLTKFAKLLNHPSCHILGVSQSAKASVHSLNIKKRVTIVHPGINWSELDKANNNIKYSLCFIGEIATNKGVHLLPHAIVELKEKFPSINCVIIGEGELKDSLISLVKLLKLQDRILFTGYLSRQEVRKFLSQSKILVHPSLSECWPNVVIEGIGLQKEIVVSRNEGSIEVANLVPYGYTFIPGSIQDMCKKISLALLNFEKRVDMRSIHAKKIQIEISIENQANQLLTLFETENRIKSQSNPHQNKDTASILVS